MPIAITCSSCNKKLQAPDSAVGKKVRCPACSAKIAVPVPEDLVEPIDDLVESDEDTGITSRPTAPNKKSARDETESEEDTGITSEPAPAKKKVAWDDKESEEEERDEVDEEDFEERRRRKRKRRREMEEEEDGDRDARPRRREEAHRGALILFCGIMAIPLAVCAPLAFIMATITLQLAHTDVKKMERGLMDPEGKAMTTAGQACAYVAIVLGLISCVAGAILEAIDPFF